MAPKLLTMAAVVLAVSLLSGCEGRTGGESRVADVALDQTEIRLPDVLPDGTVGDLPEPLPDLVEVATCNCIPGTVECKYNDKSWRRCVVDEATGGCAWTMLDKCPSNTECVEGLGCVCEYGECSDDDLAGCAVGSLGADDSWECQDGCCAVVPENVCPGDHCQDCIDLLTEETMICPDGPPEGWVFNLCTQDVCQDGKCFNVEKPCDDGNDCSIDSCNPVTGECDYTFVGPCESAVYCWGATEEEAQAKCFDDDLCTIDSCEFGEEFLPFEGDLPQFDPSCTEDHPEWPDCDPKPDNVYICKNEDKTAIGACDDADPCTIDTCDPEVGCIHECDYEGSCYAACMEQDCDDGNPCTTDTIDLQLLICKYEEMDCDDGDPCTIDYCNSGWGTCVHDPASPVTCGHDIDCDDNNWCTIDECLTDECGGTGCYSKPLPCNMDPCHPATCDPQKGCVDEPSPCVHPTDPECFLGTCFTDANGAPGCIFEPKPAPPKPCQVAVCSGGIFTYYDDLCVDYVIVNDKSVPNLCTYDSCDPEKGECVHEAKDCALGDKCLESAECAPDTGECTIVPKDCDDGNGCTVDACHPASGQCVHVAKPAPKSPCNSYACEPETGEFVATPISCDDGDECTIDTCSELIGCTHGPDPACGGCIDDQFVPDDAKCEDGNLCTINTCLCQILAENGIDCLDATCFMEAVVCPDGPPGSVSKCNPITGECEAILKNCSDDNVCTIDSYFPGGCVYEPVDCSDNNACTDDQCDPAIGCNNLGIDPQVECNDDSACTIDTCNPAVGCVNTPKDCDDENPCTTDTCEADVGCEHAPDDTQTCDDGDPETDNTCSGGFCIEVPVE